MFVFSFCLYGPPTAKYYGGLIENLKLIQTHFPDWKVFLYLGNDVPAHSIARFLQYPQVVLRHVNQTGPVLMMHRFLAIDEPGVELMMVRDADSRVHIRDRWAIRQFVESSKKAHAIRDHPYHTIEILGGLWGIKRGLLNTIGEHVRPQIERPWNFGDDQMFLRHVIYPLVKSELLVHTSRTYRYSEDETLVPFSMTWSEAQYCGKAENLPITLRFFRY